MPRTEIDTRRELIDPQLLAAGWVIQDRAQMNLYAGRGVAVREFPLSTGFADYLLFVDNNAVGVVEAKAEGTPLIGVAEQSGSYLVGLPPNIPHVTLPLPFAYESNGRETYFRSQRDPEPRSRRVFCFHRPETLAEWAQESCPLRARLQQMPPLITTGLWDAQIEAIQNLEKSLAEDRPRALIQMATGSGKTFTAVSAVYRLIKFGKARRVLFLVDRSNLGRQTLKEFQQYITPDDGRKFTELYNVQHLTSNYLDKGTKVIITTIQRLYSMLKGEPFFDPDNEEGSLFETASQLSLTSEPLPVVYNQEIPPETFDFIITDECHRSIYNLWRQVLEYFDAYIIGLTATPSKQTFGFFNRNLVMEYSRQRAVIDNVNVEGQVYRIKTKITESGSTIEEGYWVEKRDRQTRRSRWEELEDELVYPPEVVGSEVLSEDQIRLVLQTYRDKLFTELFPGRKEVPKTLIFARDDSHAEEIVRIAREEFGKGNDFCQKITYKVSGANPEDLIASFRNSYYPRVAVTVDMIATGTDIKPLEVLLFMRLVRSANFFEQMLGRGTRVINPSDLQVVTPDAERKDHFLIVDAVGTVDHPKVDTKTLERKRTVPFPKLIEAVAAGVTDEDTLSSLAGRLAGLQKKLTHLDEQHISEALEAAIMPVSKPAGLHEIVERLLDAVDPDKIEETAREQCGGADPDEAALAQAQAQLVRRAAVPLAACPQLRSILVEVQQRSEQVIDHVSMDSLIETGFSQEATDQVRQYVDSFRQYLETHKDEITALQMIYNRPYGLRQLTYQQVKELAEVLQQPPHSWTTEELWKAYARLEKDRVRGASQRRVTTDLVSLVRHALRMEDELVPFPEQVQARYQDWLAAQQAAGRSFTPEQRWWLDRMAEAVGVNLAVRIEDLDGGEFFQKGGRFGAIRTFGVKNLEVLVDELNNSLIS